MANNRLFIFLCMITAGGFITMHYLSQNLTRASCLKTKQTVVIDGRSYIVASPGEVCIEGVCDFYDTEGVRHIADNVSVITEQVPCDSSQTKEVFLGAQ